MTVDLFEEKNIGQVIRNLDTLRRITGGGAKGYLFLLFLFLYSFFLILFPFRSPAPISSSASASFPTSSSSPSFSSSSSSSSPSEGPGRGRAGSSRVPVGLREKEEVKSNSSNCSLDKDVQEKLATVGVELEQDLRRWIERLTGETFQDKNFGKSLKNGILLCQYVKECIKKME